MQIIQADIRKKGNETVPVDHVRNQKVNVMTATLTQKNARNMRKAILLSKRISARSQGKHCNKKIPLIFNTFYFNIHCLCIDAASPQQTRIIRHTRTKKRGAYS
ncbi:unnamed protein product [Brassica oleracea]